MLCVWFSVVDPAGFLCCLYKTHVSAQITCIQLGCMGWAEGVSEVWKSFFQKYIKWKRLSIDGPPASCLTCLCSCPKTSNDITPRRHKTFLNLATLTFDLDSLTHARYCQGQPVHQIFGPYVQQFISDSADRRTHRWDRFYILDRWRGRNNKSEDTVGFFSLILRLSRHFLQADSLRNKCLQTIFLTLKYRNISCCNIFLFYSKSLKHGVDVYREATCLMLRHRC